MKLEKTIKKVLNQTLECDFKRTLIEHMFGKGWVIINVKQASVDIAREIKEKITNLEK